MKLHNIGKKCVKAWGIFLLMALAVGGCKSRNESLTLLVGTYTDTDSRGIFTFRFDAKTGDTTPLTVTGLANPSFLAVTPDYTRVYAISEEAGESAITAFDYDAKEGNLTLLNRQSTLGASSCHVTWTGKNVVACSYSSGSMTVFPLDEEGRLEPGTLVPFEGSGPDSTRQERSHIHSSKLSPDGRFLFVIDLGADYIYRFPVEDGKLTSLEPYKIKVPAGQGPRHFDFSKDGRFLYLITELEGYVIVYDYNGGDLRQIQMIEADPLHARGSADIHFSPDGKFLYASNRLKGDGLAIFSQDPQTGLLSYVAYQETGIHPRNFTLSPDGRFVLVACRDSDVIQVFVRDPRTGLLQDTGQDIYVPHPVFVTLTPTDHV